MIREYTICESEKQQLLSMKQDVVDRLLAAARVLDGYGRKILTVGAYYPGIWLEHNQDNEFFVEYDPETAWNSQTLFLDFQREDGLIPCAFKLASGTEPKFPRSNASALLSAVRWRWRENADVRKRIMPVFIRQDAAMKSFWRGTATGPAAVWLRCFANLIPVTITLPG